jgi:hypothetical protein
MVRAQVKAAYLSALSTTLKKVGVLADVIEHASARTRDALENPPPPSVWIDYGICVEVYRIVGELRGRPAIRSVMREATYAGIAPFKQVFVQGLLRLFGVSPATLFTHMNKLAGQSSRGGEFVYTPTSDSSGVMTVTMPDEKDVDPSVWYASAGGFDVVFETCNVIGTVLDPTYRTDGPSNCAEFRLSWRNRRP